MSFNIRDSADPDASYAPPDASQSLYADSQIDSNDDLIVGGSANSTYQTEAAAAIVGPQGGGPHWSAATQASVRQYFESITDGSVLRFVPRLFGSTDRPSYGQVVAHAGELLESVYAARFPADMEGRPRCRIANQTVDANTTDVILCLQSPIIDVRSGRTLRYGEPYSHGIVFRVTNNNDGTVTVRPVGRGQGGDGFQISIR